MNTEKVIRDLIDEHNQKSLLALQYDIEGVLAREEGDSPNALRLHQERAELLYRCSCIRIQLKEEHKANYKITWANFDGLRYHFLTLTD